MFVSVVTTRNWSSQSLNRSNRTVARILRDEGVRRLNQLYRMDLLSPQVNVLSLNVNFVYSFHLPSNPQVNGTMAWLLPRWTRCVPLLFMWSSDPKLLTPMFRLLMTTRRDSLASYSIPMAQIPISSLTISPSLILSSLSWGWNSQCGCMLLD